MSAATKPPAIQSSAQPRAIVVRGARQHNLKGIDVEIPMGQLVVVTGLSGTGKSSLVFDTVHAEGNRRYVETFSSYTRQFLERTERPKVDAIEHIHPSIAIEQGNTVKTSRSTVGTMTELTDFFKVWFAHSAQLIDPDSGEVITIDSPDSMFQKALAQFPAQTVLLCFPLAIPARSDRSQILQSLSKQGYTRIALPAGIERIDALPATALDAVAQIDVIQDRIPLQPDAQARFVEAARTALHFGGGQLNLLGADGQRLAAFTEGLHRADSQRRFQPATPNLFSFNSPLGACPQCRGFGRVIRIDPDRIIPDPALSLSEGAIKAFSGAVYSESQRDLLRACKRHGLPTDRPWQALSDAQRAFVWEGEPDYQFGNQRWYGVRRFFNWLEENTYKMHVRVFLSRYRAYVPCPDCHGQRLNSEALCWQWQGLRLPDLYALSVDRLLALLNAHSAATGSHQVDRAREAILARLGYLQAVGLGYLSLDRPSRSLSGGETQRVHLTSCIGTALVDTLFILDEPSIGLHPRDIHRLIATLRRLTALGNTVLVVEHDESVIAAADTVIEMGPRPGDGGGQVTFTGSVAQLKRKGDSPTGRFLAGKCAELTPPRCRPIAQQTHPMLHLRGIRRHNLNGLDVAIPLNRMVVLSGVSGSGKSTLLHDAIYAGLLRRAGKAAESAAAIEAIDCPCGFSEIIAVDQSPVSKTPRSNPALFVEAWDPIRNLFAATEPARAAGLTAAAFSFNSGSGRCPHCEGLGYERVEMQFMADVYVPCPHCDGLRFRPEILNIQWQGLSISDVLALSVDQACQHFAAQPKVLNRLAPLQAVGLGYLALGQPLNALSGGEAQRLKLVRFLGKVDRSANDHALILLDEPTTGLHRADVQRLLRVLHSLVDTGHSLVVIEHHTDVIRNADWLLELGPEGGEAGGRLLFAGPPSALATACPDSPTAPFLSAAPTAAAKPTPRRAKGRSARTPDCLEILGARHHNLKNLSLTIPHGHITVLTGVSGSGKSSLAFDIIFAEGQRRFLESMSAWARQFVEQLPKPDVDAVHGIAPTIAIEQRVTTGNRKSTVATVTEVAQYLRLLFARIGIQHNPQTGQRLATAKPEALLERLRTRLAALASARSHPNRLALLAPLVRARKGHHEPIANWTRSHGFPALRCDQQFVAIEDFQRLDRFREHDVDLVLAWLDFDPHRKAFIPSTINDASDTATALATLCASALQHGKGSFELVSTGGPRVAEWFSVHRTDPVTGEAFPELDPKHFSWNSPKGWCPQCNGFGILNAEEDNPAPANDPAAPCPACNGQRLNPLARAVFVFTRSQQRFNLPDLLQLPPKDVLAVLDDLDLQARESTILNELLPEIRQRLDCLTGLGLDYLALDRSAVTLSGGEAQRIRLAAQLGSNLCGALFVLDEPSIGLHARDSQRLLSALQQLKAAGNTLLIVEHDPDTMAAADWVIDLGPGAGKAGGECLAAGTLQALRAHPLSVTGKALRAPMQHPLRGNFRPLPAKATPRAARKSAAPPQWLRIEGCRLRNLKGFDLALPLGRLIAVCGISGAGKSTLVRDSLIPAVEQAIAQRQARLKGGPNAAFKCLHNGNAFRKVIEVDQSPIGKTPRSTPATYIGAFDRIRALFATLPEARMHGLSASAFSFNTKGGRCEHCSGNGRIKLEMNFMPDSWIDCHACNASRYAADLRAIRWNGLSIAEVLDLSFSEAAAFFEFDARLHALLNLMVETGLGYLSLGQPSPTLSGGEAQRLKLVSELAKGLALNPRGKATAPSNAANLIVLEEPTIGLHLNDVQRLLDVLHRLVDQGHSVIVIEHHLDVLAEADFLVEIGPEGGQNGGQLLHAGPIHALPSSTPTAPFLAAMAHAGMQT